MYFLIVVMFLLINVSLSRGVREEVRSNFEVLLEAIKRHKCVSDLDKNFKLEYPVSVTTTSCDLDLDIAVGYSNSSSVVGQNEVIFHSHPSARGLCNQIYFNGVFFQWSKDHNKAVLPPIFHMDGYNTTNDYLLPFSFIYDRASFYEGASREGLRIVQASESVSRRKLD